MRVFKGLRKESLNNKKTANYLKYALGEIALVVIGILIALQINNWNSNRVKNQEAKQIYQQIQRTIEDDRIEIKNTKDLNKYYSTQYAKANALITAKDDSKLDSLTVLIITLSQYSDFQGTSKIYENIVNSGDIKLLKNQDINSKLQRLEMTYSYINKLEDIHWEVIINELSPELKGVINYSNMQVVKPQKIYSVELQNIVIESIFLTMGKDSIYTRALDEIDKIVGLISEETQSKP